MAHLSGLSVLENRLDAGVFILVCVNHRGGAAGIPHSLPHIYAPARSRLCTCPPAWPPPVGLYLLVVGFFAYPPERPGRRLAGPAPGAGRQRPGYSKRVAGLHRLV